MRQNIALFMLAGLLAGSMSAGAAERTPRGDAGGDAERGRGVFNGKGICYYCHGTDGRLGQRPQLSEETTRIITSLAPNPPDLRNSKQLKLKSNRDRFRLIREGHTGSGMLPDKTLTDQEITDLLAYLAVLRSR
jgi:mono/diheme cytochrome c family protein